MSTHPASGRREVRCLHDGYFDAELAVSDGEVWQALEGEGRRQAEQIELIASENSVSRAVLQAQARSSPTRRLRATLAPVTTAEPSSPTASNLSPSSGPVVYSVAGSQTCNLTPVATPTRRSIWRFCARVIRSCRWISTPVATSAMVTRQPSRHVYTTSLSTDCDRR